MKQNLQNVRLNDAALRWEGVVEVEYGSETPEGPAWVRPWRVRRQQAALYPPDLLKRSHDSAGVRLALVSNTAMLSVGLDPCLDVPTVEPQAEWKLDLYVDGELHQRSRWPRKSETLVFTGWDAGEHRLELYCDILSPVRFTSVAVDGDATLNRDDDGRPRWLVYGSSITQCAWAAGPGETWPAIVARQFDLNHTNLGYGGNAQLDAISARMIAGMPADLISVCASVNNHTAYSRRTWRSAVIGFIQGIRDGHPDTPLVCVSPVWSEPRETQPSSSGLSLTLMREQARDAVQALQAAGDANLHYVDGLEVFGPDDAHLMPDKLHPDAEGCRVLAAHYAERVMPLFGDVVARGSQRPTTRTV